MDIIKQIAAELSIRTEQVERTVELLDGGNTIPFIARYRKEATGELDETVIRSLAERLSYLRSLAERKADISRLIAEQGNSRTTTSIAKAFSLQELDDIYRPYGPNGVPYRKGKGLEPWQKNCWNRDQRR